RKSPLRSSPWGSPPYYSIPTPLRPCPARRHGRRHPIPKSTTSGLHQERQGYLRLSISSGMLGTLRRHLVPRAAVEKTPARLRSSAPPLLVEEGHPRRLAAIAK